MQRSQKLLEKININGIGLEIGPLCWPVLKKNEANIFYVDHASTEELMELYKNDSGVPRSQIVRIDYPLHGKSLKETVGKKHFNYIIASHVIEHVPDMIGWIDDMMSVLQVGGVLSLAIPDKRFTFDIDRDVSTVADVLGAHMEKRTKPSSRTVLDYAVNYRGKVDPRQAWQGQMYTTEEAGPHKYSLDKAYQMALKNRDTEEYIDTHCFTYTPSSFVALLKGLCELKMATYQLVALHDTGKNEYEFFVTLKKTAKLQSPRHLEKLSDTLIDWAPRQTEIENRKLKENVSLLKQELESIRASSSWKITRPLRFGTKAARALKHKITRD